MGISDREAAQEWAVDHNNVFTFDWWVSEQSFADPESLTFPEEVSYLMERVAASQDELRLYFLGRLASYLNKSRFFPVKVKFAQPFKSEIKQISGRTLTEVVDFMLSSVEQTANKQSDTYRDIWQLITQDAAFSLYVDSVTSQNLNPPDGQSQQAGRPSGRGFGGGRGAPAITSFDDIQDLLPKLKTEATPKGGAVSMQKALNISFFELRRYVGLKLEGRSPTGVVSNKVLDSSQLADFLSAWINNVDSKLKNTALYRDFLNLARWTLAGVDPQKDGGRKFEAITKALSACENSIGGGYSQIAEILAKWHVVDLDDYVRMVNSKAARQVSYFQQGLQLVQEKLPDNHNRWLSSLRNLKNVPQPLSSEEAVSLIGIASKRLAWVPMSSDLRDPNCYKQLLGTYKFLKQFFERKQDEFNIETLAGVRDDKKFKTWQDLEKACTTGMKQKVEPGVDMAVFFEAEPLLKKYYRSQGALLASVRTANLHNITLHLSKQENTSLFSKKIFRIC